ncbi:uncharacterized protein V1518DRAFT_429163 [Limtongia smithiae]|uniref:uncharacterized protein n=1 Tax=Limtongia smithiae TaxID=1125753 RepID=UPI0034CFD383
MASGIYVYPPLVSSDYTDADSVPVQGSLWPNAEHSKADTPALHTMPSSSPVNAHNTGTTSNNKVHPVLHKTRSRHFETFQNNYLLANSADDTFMQPQQSSRFDYGVDMYVQQQPTVHGLGRDPTHHYEFGTTASSAYVQVTTGSAMQSHMWAPPPLMTNRMSSYGYQWMDQSPSMMQSDFQGGRMQSNIYGSPSRVELAPMLSQTTSYDSANDDHIPNAIVIKNIPFSVQVEHMNTLMSDLGLELPYAFNFHYDNGVFRGLAFANFRNTTDTAKAIAVLNGYEFGGRKLRAEYKKMLPKEERDRQEQQKRMRRGQMEDQQPQQLHQLRHQSSLSSFSLSSAQAVVSAQKDKLNVNMNDPLVRSIYDRILFFSERDDPLEELSFDTTQQSHRRAVHYIANFFKHVAVADGERVVVYKRGNPKCHGKPLSHATSSGKLMSMHLSSGSISGQQLGTSPTHASSRPNVFAPLPINSISTAAALLDHSSVPSLSPSSSKTVSPIRSLRNTKSFADIRTTSRLNGMYKHMNTSSSSLNGSYNNNIGTRSDASKSNVPAIPDMSSLLQRMSLSDIQLTAHQQQLITEQGSSLSNLYRNIQSEVLME